MAGVVDSFGFVNAVAAFVALQHLNQASLSQTVSELQGVAHCSHAGITQIEGIFISICEPFAITPRSPTEGRKEVIRTLVHESFQYVVFDLFRQGL